MILLEVSILIHLTNNLDSLSSVNRDNSKDTIHSDSQDNKTVESIEKSNNESKNNKEDIVMIAL